METIKKLFRESFDAMYEGCELLAMNVEEEMVKMNAFKKKYNAMWVDSFRGKIEAARLLEDDVQRRSRHKLLRIELKRMTREEITDGFGSLRLYIRDAFEDEAERKLGLKTAGFNDLRRALNYNWSVLRTVMQKGSSFIAEQRVVLQANENMPDGFEDWFNGLKDFVDEHVPTFLNVRENKAQGQEAKVVASNALYEIALSVCEDGQHVFKRNPAKQKQFIWMDLMQLVSPKGSAGLKFDVKEEGVNAPVKGAEVVLQREGDEQLKEVTDEKGRGLFSGLKEGVYKGRLSHAGFEAQDLEVVIRKGVVSFKHWVVKRG